MIVELAGAPGTGKTTLSAAVRDGLAEQGFHAMSREEALALCLARGGRARAALAFGVRHGALAARVLAAQARRRAPWRERSTGLCRFARDAAHHALLARHLGTREAVVVAEGLVQRVVGLYVSAHDGPRAQDVAAYAARLPRGIGAVILVRSPAETCVARVAARGLPRRLSGGAAPDVERFIRYAADALETTCAALAARGFIVAGVDNAGTLAAAAAGARAALAQVTAPAAAPGEAIR
jgi:hypothetical protein